MTRRRAARTPTLIRTAAAIGLMATGASVIAQPILSANQAMAKARRMTEATPACPVRGTVADAIMVCGHRREDPFRIPEVIRAEPQPRRAGAATAWGTRNEDAEEAARAGRINSSSPDGSGGQSGLAQRTRREWERERQMLAAGGKDGPDR